MAGQFFSLSGDQESPATLRMRVAWVCTLHRRSTGPGTIPSVTKLNPTSASSPMVCNIKWTYFFLVFPSSVFYKQKKKLHLKRWRCNLYRLQRNRRRLPPLVMGTVCHSGYPTAATVTTCTTVSRVSPGQTPYTTASRSRQIWCPSTAERRWSSSGTSTTPNITTSGSASPGTATVSIKKDKGTMIPCFVTWNIQIYVH